MTELMPGQPAACRRELTSRQRKLAAYEKLIIKTPKAASLHCDDATAPLHVCGCHGINYLNVKHLQTVFSAALGFRSWQLFQLGLVLGVI